MTDNPTPPSNQPTGTYPGNPPPQNSSASGKAITALILGIASLLCCGFLSGIPAFFVGRSAENDVTLGLAPESGRVLAKIGWILGLVGTILSCLGTILYALFIWFAVKNGADTSGIKF